MPAASALRLQIEHALERRFLAALSPVPRTIRDVAPTGIDELDRLLEGGLPVGAISEIVGPASSGRTSLALAFLAQRTAESRVCAWVDAGDALDPESAAANAVDLRRLLWVRCSDWRPSDIADFQKESSATRLVTGHDLSRAANAPKSIGALAPEGSVNQACPSRAGKQKDKPWTRLDQALRATDLLLQAAGFAAIVLDLGDIAREHGNRIPLATWFRFRQAADRTRCSLIVLGQASYAQSSAAAVLECSPLEARDAGGTVLRGFTFHLQRGRQRLTPIHTGERKPPASTWSATSAWETEKRA